MSYKSYHIRFKTNKCLWLVRMKPEDIAKLHHVILSNEFVVGTSLDIVETAAVYGKRSTTSQCPGIALTTVSSYRLFLSIFLLIAALPEAFPNDGDGKKAALKRSLEDKLKAMMKQLDNKSLIPAKCRHPAYKGQEPLFGDDQGFHYTREVSSEGYDKPRRYVEELRELRRLRVETDLEETKDQDIETAGGAAAIPRVLTPRSSFSIVTAFLQTLFPSRREQRPTQSQPQSSRLVTGDITADGTSNPIVFNDDTECHL